MDKRKNEIQSPETHSGNIITTGPDAEIKPDIEKLRDYTQTKLALAGQLRIVREALLALGRENSERQCGELIVKLAEDRFILAVLGQFKRGKSSLMNAIIGLELLPTGMLPITSAITVLKYGPVERLVVNRKDSVFPEELPVSSLAEFVTEKGNPGNLKKVMTACVELPVPFLRRGLEFVDTPGVGSSITANTATTYGFLPECDAVLYVISVDTPMTSIELEFLKEIREYVNRIFFVVNKIDLVAENEREAILNFVDETIRTQSGYETIKVFPVSARLGLAARTSGDEIQYELSGLKAIEEALASFLSGEKLDTFLAEVARKALRILNEEATQGTFGEDALQARAKAIQDEKTVKFNRNPHTAVNAIKDAKAKLEIIYQNILSHQIPEAEKAEHQAAFAAESTPIAKIPVDAPTPKRIDLVADLQFRGCPVCQHRKQQSFDFFSHWQYQLSTEEQAQSGFATELGFCPAHTWQLLSISSAHGASVGFTQLVEHIAHRLHLEKSSSAKGNSLRQLVHDTQSCRVCKMLQRVEAEYIVQLAAFISETAGRNQYLRSQGVCLHHLAMLTDVVTSDEDRDFLISHAAQRFDEDAEDMRTFALKGEALRRDLQNRDEEDAYLRAIVRMVGAR
jgi:GTPase SAR1 family protein